MVLSSEASHIVLVGLSGGFLGQTLWSVSTLMSVNVLIFHLNKGTGAVHHQQINLKSKLGGSVCLLAPAFILTV